ncbi:hypothetical protein [Haloarcula pellucida]|uniref:Uncharacterized protein n=1 Tax=Haloarcula pellucida TaxID=1427151 RepID=A0A830GTA0_9EURY|nr:hypothetical protein [Halomicroarcula pellucida]MBX0350514.1 hypothetical protein [Halomicroarcula pellucida]GGO03684.1 hypothetical protein GCM10009030_39600 [Halomicroarcula pellucida]
MSDALQEVLTGAVPLFEDDMDRLVEWAEAVQDADGKLQSGAGFGMDTTGRTTEIHATVGDTAAEANPGSFDEGWIATPGLSSECDCTDDEQPIVALSHRERDLVLIDCINCGVRYDVDALDGDRDD